MQTHFPNPTSTTSPSPSPRSHECIQTDTHRLLPVTHLRIISAIPHNNTNTSGNITFTMSKRTDQLPSPTEKDKRSSFSLSSGFQSVKRAVSGRGRKSEKDTEASAAKDAEAAADRGLDSSNPFNDPPPSYTVTEAEASGQSVEQDSVGKGPARVLSLYSRLRGPAASEDDKFRFLSEFDTVFLIDDSSSMNTDDNGHSISRDRQNKTVSRWGQTRDVIKQIVPICMKYDQDGVDLYFLNDPFLIEYLDRSRREPHWSIQGDKEEGKATFGYIGVRDADIVNKIFNSRQPTASTPTGKRLGEIMKTYVDCYQTREAAGQPPPKPLNIIVITDGEANSQSELRRAIVGQAERLDSLSAPYHQLGVQFFQVGKDASAAKHLHTLDDNIVKNRGGQELRDIVDCITFEELSGEGREKFTADMILKVVLGAVNKHLDHQRIRQGLLVPPR
ncbi:hypothetical protein F4825DRAFT_433444 [Nemania diffusa]|nr:hypothetical protein F4825DRAFT_433444 [Nemania diffusa]